MALPSKAAASAAEQPTSPHIPQMGCITCILYFAVAQVIPLVDEQPALCFLRKIHRCAKDVSEPET